MRFSSSSLLPSRMAWNNSPASQAEPMISPSRRLRISDLGIRGTRLKYSRLELEIR